MAKTFINSDFILTNETAKHLYHDFAEKMHRLPLSPDSSDGCREQAL